MSALLDLAPYRLPLASMPEEAQRVHALGVQSAEPPSLERFAQQWLDGSGCADGVFRGADGRALVACTTHLPDVTPAMIDWWFGWHLPDSERYRLWHPLAHRKARVREDRSQSTDDRERYVGNVSYVDEYIGSALQRLAIAFQEPARFGVPTLPPHEGTAVCAVTSDRTLASEGGRLVHLVLRTPEGCVMHSAFALGEITNQLPLVGALVTRVVNRAALRRIVISDRFLLDLFQHCSEEMNHLGKFLVRLYRAAHGS